jgi:hypothetical protein
MPKDRTTSKGSNRARIIRQDACFVVSALLALATLATVLTSLGGDESELFGLDDDLHALVGWSMATLALIHMLLHSGQMVRYAKRRTRSLLGVGAVSPMSCEGGLETDERSSRQASQSEKME